MHIAKQQADKTGQKSSQSQPLQTPQHRYLQMQKLKQQNLHLYNQVFELESEVNEALQKNRKIKNKNYEIEHQLSLLYGQQIDEQQKKIKKLKQQLYYIKSSNALANIQYINKQEDELIVITRSRDQLRKEKILMKAFVKDKHAVLQKNLGLDDHKRQLQNQCTQAKRINQKHSSNIVQMQREVRKYHYLHSSFKSQRYPRQNTHKDNVNQEGITYESPYEPNGLPENHDLEYQSIINQIMVEQQHIKQIQQKWKPNIQALDREYFQLVSLQRQKKQLEQTLQKSLKTYLHRSKSLRDSDQILSDRIRMAKIITTTSSAGFSSKDKKQKNQQKVLNLQSIQKLHHQAEDKRKMKSQYLMGNFQKLKAKRDKPQQFYQKSIESNLTADIKTQKQPKKYQIQLSSTKQKGLQKINKHKNLTLFDKVQNPDKRDILPKQQQAELKNVKSDLRLSLKEKKKVILSSRQPDEDKILRQKYQKIDSVKKQNKQQPFIKQKSSSNLPQKCQQKLVLASSEKPTVSSKLQKAKEKTSNNLSKDKPIKKDAKTPIAESILVKQEQNSSVKKDSIKQNHIKKPTCITDQKIDQKFNQQVLKKQLLIQERQNTQKTIASMHLTQKLTHKQLEQQIKMKKPIPSHQQTLLTKFNSKSQAKPKQKQKSRKTQQANESVSIKSQVYAGDQKVFQIKLENKTKQKAETAAHKFTKLNGQHNATSNTQHQSDSFSKDQNDPDLPEKVSDINQTFKPYLVKRKRPIEGLKPSQDNTGRDEQSHKKSIIELVQKKSIGVGI